MKNVVENAGTIQCCLSIESSERRTLSRGARGRRSYTVSGPINVESAVYLHSLSQRGRVGTLQGTAGENLYRFLLIVAIAFRTIRAAIAFR